MCKICEAFGDVIRETNKAWDKHKQYAHNPDQNVLFDVKQPEVLICPACLGKRRHSDAEWKEFHVLSRSGKCDDRKIAGG